MDIVISVEDFQYYWKRAEEKTASSFSGLHFEHYRSITHSDVLSKVHALKLSLITKKFSTRQMGQRPMCYAGEDHRGCPNNETKSNTADGSALQLPQQTHLRESNDGTHMTTT